APVGHPHALTATILADPVRRLRVCLALVAIQQTVRQPPPFGGTAGFCIASIAGPNRASPVKWSVNRLFPCVTYRFNIFKVRANSATLQAITVSSGRLMATLGARNKSRAARSPSSAAQSTWLRGGLSLVVHLGPVGAGTARRRLLLRNLRDHRFRRQHERSDRRGVLERGSGHLGGVDHAGHPGAPGTGRRCARRKRWRGRPCVRPDVARELVAVTGQSLPV